MMSLLAIDPGLNGTGYALWRAESAAVHQSRHWAPWRVGVLNYRRHKDEDWTEHAWYLAQLIQILRISERTRVVCEFTEYHHAAHRVMAWKTGDLQKLTFLCGVIFAATRPNPFEAVPTSHWKGQLPKALVEQRIRNRLGPMRCRALGIKTHAFDAVGLGLWAMGVWK